MPPPVLSADLSDSLFEFHLAPRPLERNGSGLGARRREFRRSLMTERTVLSMMAVLESPVFRHDHGLEDAREELSVEVLVTEAADGRFARVRSPKGLPARCRVAPRRSRSLP